MGVGVGIVLVDTAGRRPLLIWGSACCCLSLLALALADWATSAVLVVVSMCIFILAFSLSYAGVFWVLISELFSMSVKSPAASAATSMLFIAGGRAQICWVFLLVKFVIDLQ